MFEEKGYLLAREEYRSTRAGILWGSIWGWACPWSEWRENEIEAQSWEKERVGDRQIYIMVLAERD